MLSCEIRDRVAYLELDHPPVNILSQSLMDKLADTLETLASDDSLVALLIRGKGKAFSAGADIGEHEPERAAGMISSFSRLFRNLDSLEIPVLMTVHGAALGAGFELAMMADLLLASESATFGQPEIRLGFFAPIGVVELPALVGRARAMEITCSGKTYAAEELRGMGFPLRVLGESELEEETEKVLKDFRRASSLVMRLNVRTLKKLRGRPFRESLAEAERVFLEELMSAEDPREGIAAFYEKRRPEWKNR
ncbi:MAG: enoyl-CoA hydratase/isomerase family protein [Candidatus Krumholzibacteria bacterium]|jgi:cyclohexa-1,5-dienecarbonyl-CoA hydratase|nr:enoyl-CoA hydratase/isomerase family protein [Candidatus Krumholzibacteria bacterium]MDP6668437.1 enoyl-CoA hydratase/isomerase family protein [Candidatus Krumholzibacteria bacterium]MDP6797258.1 enoyl-CoA hydratase/isomerase family protein [Candidatus Krumholzibacteria bacterium]MDP7021839.1 enoyl-CoA hydratase/isomerase family protein [Candidatus Krumholzibacteria bacterium]